MKVYNKPGLIKKDNEYHFFLFNDLLVYAQRLPGLEFYNYKHSIPILGMEVNDVPDTDKPDSIKFAFKVKGKDSKKLLLYAQTQPQKYDWLSALMPLIEKAQKNISTLHVTAPTTPSPLIETAKPADAKSDKDGKEKEKDPKSTVAPAPVAPVQPVSQGQVFQPSLEKKVSTAATSPATTTANTENRKKAPPPPRPTANATTATSTTPAAPTSPTAETAQPTEDGTREIRAGTQAGVPFNAPPM
jgi:hypothetical protein